MIPAKRTDCTWTPRCTFLTLGYADSTSKGVAIVFGFIGATSDCCYATHILYLL